MRSRRCQSAIDSSAAHGLDEQAPGTSHWRAHLALIGLLLAIGLVMFGQFLLPGTQRILGSASADMPDAVVPWRHFGVTEVSRGNLPLWNPHVFSGIPYFGAQSGLLYPLNFVFLVMPLALACNACLALHICLLGVSMYLWVAFRGLRPLACFTSGVLGMFSGAMFWRIWAGHTGIVCSMPWIVLVFLATDGLLTQPRAKWSMLGMFAGAMIVLAGYPPALLWAAVAATAYALQRLLTPRIALLLSAAPGKRRGKSDRRDEKLVSWKAIVGWSSAAALGGLMLMSLQLATSVMELKYGTRGGGLPWEVARSYSLPPEAVLTWIAPFFFGWMADGSLWGRSFPWEASLYFSVAGFALALFGAVRRGWERHHADLATASFLLLLAMGGHIPVFGRLCYDLMPGFSSMRGWGKFGLPMTMFCLMLTAYGVDEILRRRTQSRRWWQLFLAASVLIGLSGVLVFSAADSPRESWWRQGMQWVHDGGEEFGEPVPSQSKLDTPEFTSRAATGAAKGLMISSGTVAAVAFLFWLLGRWRLAPHAMVAVAIGEILAFAYPLRPSFEIPSATAAAVGETLRSDPGDYRVLQIGFGNQANLGGYRDIWGNEPVGVRRYAEFMAFSQGMDPNFASPEMPISRGNSMMSLLRLKYVFVPPEGRSIWKRQEPPLPRLMIVRRHRVVKGRDDQLRAIASSDFDPREEVLLEQRPEPAPEPATTTSTARIVDESTDHLTIEADLPAPAILVITDVYHPYWRAYPLAGSVQSSYTVMPGNWILRAVPLKAGRHLFRMEYRPPGFTFLCWIFGLSWAAFLGASLWLLRRWSNAR